MARASVRDLRFLPLVIFFAALALLTRAELLVSGLPRLFADAVVIADAQAADTPAGADSGLSAAAAGQDGPASEAAPAPSPVAAAVASDPAVPPAGPAAPDTGAPGSSLSDAEIAVLQQLSERRAVLDQRETELSERSVLLEAAEARIEGKVQELRDLKVTLEQLIATYQQQEDAKISSLVKIYENMKPKDAAKIFEELEMDTLLLVAERMKERKLAPIMANMDPGKAKEMTVELARLRRIPDPPAGGSSG